MREGWSEVNHTRQITEQWWFLTLARKTQGSHQQHAFFILEGIEDEKAVIWFMDFVGPDLGPWLPNIMHGQIRCGEEDGCKFSAVSKTELQDNPLIFRCRRRMMDLEEGNIIAAIQWRIDSESARQLIDTIRHDKEHPPVFNIFGQTSIFTHASASSSSKERGHNCFTYARSKIIGLENPDIEIEDDPANDCIEKLAGVSKRTLRNRYILERAATEGEQQQITIVEVVVEPDRTAPSTSASTSAAATASTDVPRPE